MSGYIRRIAAAYIAKAASNSCPPGECTWRRKALLTSMSCVGCGVFWPGLMVSLSSSQFFAMVSCVDEVKCGLKQLYMMKTECWRVGHVIHTCRVARCLGKCSCWRVSFNLKIILNISLAGCKKINTTRWAWRLPRQLCRVQRLPRQPSPLCQPSLPSMQSWCWISRERTIPML